MESVTTSNISVAVIGAGAVGLLYGGRLLQADRVNVHFLARGNHESLCKGLCIESEIDGNFLYRTDIQMGKHGKRMHSNVTDMLQANGDQGFDVIIISTKSTCLTSVMPLVTAAARTDGETRVLALMNGLGVEERIAELGAPIIQRKKICGCMAFVCANKNSTADGEIVNHIAYGALQIGNLCDDMEEVSFAVGLFAGTCIEVKVTAQPCLLKARWGKLCWNIPFSGISVAMGGITTDLIANDPNLRELATLVMREVLILANIDLLSSQTSNIEESIIDESIIEESNKAISIPDNAMTLPIEETMSYCWKLTDTMGPYKTSASIDLVSGNAIEVEFLFDAVLQRLKKHREIHSQKQQQQQHHHHHHQHYHQQPLKCDHLESLLLMVKAVAHVAELRKEQNMPKWSAVWGFDSH